METYLIGLDYGTESARGVLIHSKSGEIVMQHTEAYPDGVMTRELANGTPLARAWALQNAADYTFVAERILSSLGRGRVIESIGLGFTASSPMPTTFAGLPLSSLHPNEPHAYVKLWKHASAQPQAEVINRRGGDFLDNFGGRLSGEWLIAKAAQLAEEAPKLWAETEKFIEAGDWLVWQLTGRETRSLGFAAYKAQYGAEGYPKDVLPGLVERLSKPEMVGSSAGHLSEEWRDRTGIEGPAVIAVAVIDSHVVLPAIGAVSGGCLVGALGTSAVYLLLEENYKPLPKGIEGVARDGSIRDLWCYEAGQAGFGDMLAWFVKEFPKSADVAENFAIYNAAAERLDPGANHLVAIDWWSGNRVPFADSGLSGAIVGFNMQTTAVGIYRALIEALCFGAKSIADLFEAGDLPIERVILTSGLAKNNPFLVQTMADVLGRPVDVPSIAHPTAVGAAVHGAVAAGLVADYREGTERFGAKTFEQYRPDAKRIAAFAQIYGSYKELCDDVALKRAIRVLDQP